MKLRRTLAAATAALLACTLISCSSSTKETSSKTDSGSPSSDQGGTQTDGGSTDSGSAYKSLGDYLNDPKFHQAIKLAIDMPSVIDGLMGGKAKPANTLMPAGPFKPTSGLNDWTYDPDKAKALLKEIGWDSSQELNLVHYYGDQGTVDFMSAVQQYLAKVGIKVAPKKLEGDLGSQLWTAPKDPVKGPSAVKWDLAYGAVAALAPQEYYNRFLSDYPGNSYFPKNDEFESLIRAASATADHDQQVAAFGKVVEWDNKNLPAVPLYYQPIFVVSSDRLDRAGADIGNEQYSYDWDIKDWTVPATNGKQVLRTNGGAVEFFEAPFLNPGLFMSTKVLYDHLLVASADLSTFQPQLAKSYQVSDDGLTVTFTMRDGVTWHDGKPLTADDVKFTIELAAKVQSLNSVFDSTFAKLKGIDEYRDGSADHISGVAVSGDTVTLTFTSIDPNVLLTFSQLPPLPQHLLKDADPLTIQQNPYFQKPVGSGPFALDTVRMGEKTVFKAFDGYWNGRPKIDEIDMYPSTESDPNLVTNTEAGKVDYAYTKSVDDATALDGVSGIKITSVDVMYTRMLFVNGFPRS